MNFAVKLSATNTESMIHEFFGGAYFSRLEIVGRFDRTVRRFLNCKIPLHNELRKIVRTLESRDLQAKKLSVVTWTILN
jgi:hypothetical protein